MTPPREVELVPVGAVDEAELAALAAALSGPAGAACHVGARMPLTDACRDPLTRRYRAAAVLDALAPRARPGARVLGITEADLRGEGVGSVFGEADRGTQCAVVALARLREGRGEAQAVFRARLLAEAVHELNHLAGLDHCTDPACVMFLSANIADTDRKGSELCPRCAALRGRGERET